MQREPNKKLRRVSTIALRVLGGRFEEWRRNRKTRGPIPLELLKEARELVGPFSASTVAKALRLHYRHVGKVKSHFAAARRGVSPAASAMSTKPIGPTFVKVPLEHRGATAGMEPGRAGLVEFENPRGFKARIFVGSALSVLAHELIRAIGGGSR